MAGRCLVCIELDRLFWGLGMGIGIGIGIRIGKDLVGLIGLVRMGNDLRTLILRTRAGGV